MFKIRIDNQNSVHTTFTVFSGPYQGNLANCGRLIMRNNEFNDFLKGLRTFVSIEAKVKDRPITIEY